MLHQIEGQPYVGNAPGMVSSASSLAEQKAEAQQLPPRGRTFFRIYDDGYEWCCVWPEIDQDQIQAVETHSFKVSLFTEGKVIWLDVQENNTRDKERDPYYCIHKEPTDLRPPTPMQADAPTALPFVITLVSGSDRMVIKQRSLIAPPEFSARIREAVNEQSAWTFDPWEWAQATQAVGNRFQHPDNLLAAAQARI